MTISKYAVIASLLVISSVTRADDTEIFTGGGGAGNENILLIMDTSGSMSAWANDTDTPPYDPSVTYEAYGFAADSYYLYRSESVDDIQALTNSEVAAIKANEISLSALNCSSSGAINNDIVNSGFSSNTYSFFEPGHGWEGSDVSTASGSILQCRESGDYNYGGSNYDYLVNAAGWTEFSYPYTNTRRVRGACLLGGGWLPCFVWDYTDTSYDWDNSTYNVIWSGNYLNYRGSDLGNQQKVMRIDVVKQAAKDVVGAMSSPNKSVALMRFNSFYYSSGWKNGDGAYVDLPMTPVTELGDDFDSAIDSYDALGGTPIEQSLYEAYRYLSGGNVKYGKSAHYATWYDPIDPDWRDENDPANPGIIEAIRYNNGATGNFEVVGTSSSSGSRTGWTYNAPEFDGCEPSTKIVYFSDGAPSGYDNASSDIQALISGKTLGSATYLNYYCETSSNIGGECAEELAYYLNNYDHRDDIIGRQNITVSTIGGFISADETAKQKLEDIAEAGGGKFYLADNYEDLVESFTQELAGDVLSDPATFTSPAIAVSSYNSLELSDELYYAVFEPREDGTWSGNLKRYSVSSQGVLDRYGNPAVDPDSGYFNETAVSYWSDTIDGAEVSKGGAAERLGDKARNILTTSGSTVQALTEQSILALSDDVLGLELLQDDSLLSLPDLNLSAKQRLAKWITGKNADDTARLEIEDPIHSRPVVINYADERKIVYVGTNSGYLHAFDTENGKEVFSLIPREVLRNPLFYVDGEDNGYAEKIYGIDGPITYWHNDTNYNGTVDGEETIYLYVGLRRGGHSYYAFDVSDPYNPELAWEQHGPYTDSITKNAPAVSDGYSSLGQTWSALRPGLVNYEDTQKVVLFAGGGYDPDEDGTNLTGPETRITHDIGNTIYMIDAETGEVLWNALEDVSGMDEKMTSSFAADVTPIDVDANGTVDLLYAADVGGRIWRFDFNDTETFSATGGIIADINTSDVDGLSGNRRFYNKPDIAYFEEGDENYILISIGSGYRAHPLNTGVNDKFYLIKDPHGIVAPETYTTLLSSDLAEWGTDEAVSPTGSSNGWVVSLTNSGEKVLSPSLTLSEITTFNTFAPTSDLDAAQCSGNLGFSRTFTLAITAAAKAKCGDECDAQDETPEGRGEVPRLKPDPTITGGGWNGNTGENGEKDCINNPADCDCEDYTYDILSGTTLSSSFTNSCDTFKFNYWKEE
ncbi:MAG: hypothetical protein C9355_11205 [Thalassolituus maritimus]|nr:MAG: hypothetical protein C9355_11205 [Thalassolituus maritimus]